ncbi:hypothetical protein PR048_027525 [Dryococelus australis]|uniref:Cytochrome c biogenesis B n=1 Tax=Dryococelus australis TaxID=614101 RepID=A0ABQ9GGR3_9NEOP|nr:hypothetical protein PR048_027525 [Dryococelus australis]
MDVPGISQGIIGYPWDILHYLKGCPSDIPRTSRLPSLPLSGGRGGRAVSLLTSHRGETGSIPGRVTPRFSQVGIVPDDAAGRWILSGISLHTRLASPSSALKNSILRAAQISALFIHSFSLPYFVTNKRDVPTAVNARIGYSRPRVPPVSLILRCTDARRQLSLVTIVAAHRFAVSGHLARL